MPNPNGLPTCDVLRCQNEMTTVFATGDGARRLEYRVCEEHDAYLRQGGEWRLEAGAQGGREQLLVHPDDLSGDGVWLVERGVEVSSSFATQVSSRNQDGSDVPVQLTFEAKRYGGDVSELVLQFSRQQMLELRDMLIMMYGDHT